MRRGCLGAVADLRQVPFFLVSVWRRWSAGDGGGLDSRQRSHGGV